MTTLTPDETRKIEAFLSAHPRLAVGVGTSEEPCSVAAINLALTGRLTDKIPDCMSPVVGAWIIHIQDAMPASIRNSERWRNLLPRAAGTGREHEQERLDVILDWMWSTVLPTVQPLADERGFGAEWRMMCEGRTTSAANAAFSAANANANAAANAASAAVFAAAYAPSVFWTTVDPAGLLERLVQIGETK